MTYEEYLLLSDEYKIGWKETKAYVQDECVGIVLTKRSEIHIIPFTDSKRSITRKNIYTHLTPIFKRYGQITTKFKDDEGCTRLASALGMRKLGHDNGFSHWVLDSMPYKKVTNGN